MGDDDWASGLVNSVGVFLNGEAITDRDRRGQRVTDGSFLLLRNAQAGSINWTLPGQRGKRWEAVLDTSAPGREGEPFDSGVVLAVGGRSSSSASANRSSCRQSAPSSSAGGDVISGGRS